MEQQVFDPAILVLDIQEGKIQGLHCTNSKGEGIIHMKTRSVSSSWKTYKSKSEAWKFTNFFFIFLRNRLIMFIGSYKDETLGYCTPQTSF